MSSPPEGGTATIGRVAEIAADNRSGATALAERSALALAELAGDDSCTLERITSLGLDLIAAQPSMASITNLVNRVLLAAEKAGGAARAAGGAANQFVDQLRANVRACAEEAAGLLASQQFVATYSASTVVREALMRAARRNSQLEVLCSESRPVCEGMELAGQLAKANVRVTLLTDAALMSRVGHCGAVLVGADCLLAGGVVNKIGTSALATCARAADVPLLVLATREKWLPTRAEWLFALEDHAPEEVTSHPVHGVTVENAYFDLTPYALVSQVVTERGVVDPAAIPDQLQEMKVSKWLLPRSSR